MGAADAPVMTVGTVVILELTGPRASSLMGFPSRPRSPLGALGQLFRNACGLGTGYHRQGRPGSCGEAPTSSGDTDRENPPPPALYVVDGWTV